jgi:hypothetical protein
VPEVQSLNKGLSTLNVTMPDMDRLLIGCCECGQRECDGDWVVRLVLHNDVVFSAQKVLG